MESPANAGSQQMPARLAMLVGANVDWLRQAHDLVAGIVDNVYATSPQQMEPHRVGSHIRHILDFYECFLTGLETSHIDYDARKRDESIETSRVAAGAKIGRLMETLRTSTLLRGDSLVWVRIEDADEAHLTDAYVTSSIGRELQSLTSRTVHHFALIGMTVKAHGVPVDPAFGVAPSTLRHQAALSGR